MKTTFMTVTSLFLCGASIPAHADLSLSGAVGLPLNPTAQLPMTKVEVQGGYQNLGNLTALGFKVSEVKSYGLHAAALLGNRLEINAGFNKLHASDPTGLGVDDLSDSSASFGAKLLLLKAKDDKGVSKGVSVAIGANSDRALFHNNFYYLVASKPVPIPSTAKLPGMIHLGVRHDHFSTGDIGGPSSNKFSVYGGVEVPLDSKGAFSLVAELGGRNNDMGREVRPYSYGIRYGSPCNRLSASVGLERQGVTGDGGLYAQIGVGFGKNG